MSNTRQCVSYIDFLGASANTYKTMFGHSYLEHVCVYALSANLVEESGTYTNDAIKYLARVAATKLNWNTAINTAKLKFAKSNTSAYMCYNFKQPNITTESDTEPDAPYSYEELFDDCVLNHMNSSTGMQYKYIYSAYSNMNSQTVTNLNKTTKELALNNFKTTNNLASDENFVRSDYYKFFVPETDIIHSRSILELNDDTNASVSNHSHESFNCLLYCINPYFNANTDAGSYNAPHGFNDTNFKAIPISLCTFSNDIIMAGNNVVFEPNLNGIVTVE